MTIQVKEQHIEFADFFSMNADPVALALKEATMQAWITESYRLTNTTNEKQYRTPEIVSDFMDRCIQWQLNKNNWYYKDGKREPKLSYDVEYLRPKPFEFELNIK